MNILKPFVCATAIIFFVAGCEKPRAITKAKEATNASAPSTLAKARPSNPIDTFLYENFNKNTNVLPVSFGGNNWDEIEKSLKDMRPIKEEYETSLEHKKRMKLALAKPLYGSVRGDGILALTSRVTNRMYDADKGILKVFAFPSALPPNYIVSVPIKESKIEQGSYSGQNIFGVSAPIYKSEIRATVLSPTHQKLSQINLNNHIKISPEEAKKIVNHRLSILYIGQLSSPYLADSLDWHTPKINDPFDTKTYYTAIGFTFNEAWLFDQDTGKILSKKINIFYNNQTGYLEQSQLGITSVS